MDIHDYITDELFRIKSVAACIYLLERGRELEFTYNNKEYFMSGDGSAKSYSLCASLKNAFPDYTNKVKTNQQLMCSALNRSVAVKVTETRNNYKKASGNWFAFAAKTALDVIKAQTKYSKSKIKGILSFLNIVISVSEQISKAASISSSATYSFHATKRGCVYDSTVQNGYVLVVRYLDNSKRFNGQYNESGSFYWTQEYTSVLAMSDSTVLNTALNNYNNDLLTNNLLCTYYPEYYQWSD